MVEPVRSDEAGCPKCGHIRCDPVNFDDNDNLIIKCQACGHMMMVQIALTFDTPDRNGNVITRESFKRAFDARRSDNKSAS